MQADRRTDGFVVITKSRLEWVLRWVPIMMALVAPFMTDEWIKIITGGGDTLDSRGKFIERLAFGVNYAFLGMVIVAERLKKNLEKKESSGDWLRCIDICEGHIMWLAMKKLKFKHDGSDRISLYWADGRGNFVRAARFCQNPKWNSGGRGFYPGNQGCLGKAWETSWCYDAGFPDPNTDWVTYKNRQAMGGVSEADLQGFGMKSRFYFGVRFSDADGRKPRGVIIVESTNPARFTEDELRRVFDDGEQHYISHLTEMYADDVPRLDDARKAGL